MISLIIGVVIFTKIFKSKLKKMQDSTPIRLLLLDKE